MARNALEQQYQVVAAKLADLEHKIEADVEGLKRKKGYADADAAEADYEASLHELQHARMHSEDGIELSFDSVRVSESALDTSR